MAEFVKVWGEELIRRTSRLAFAIWREHYIPIVGEAQVEYMLDKFQSERAIARSIAEGCEYCLTTTAGEDAGYFALQIEPEKKAFLSKFYVAKRFRGEGLGRESLEYVKQLAEAGGADEIYLTVNKNNSDSIRIYEKLGFENRGSIVMDIGGGYVMDDYKMVFELGG
ncbi:GNAT family N-acetyltransferase [Sedimentisphaera salicampi]|uniref:Spermine/spermidine acetyltransferase n=1 Tax=Sedimentisphaera salicampi TaxID=1941349 RepID=A0A1W6LNM4_9BACT|nr:GNAT family N-acetyltransferase [Sedimentisphaera salicampi]ARN57379.1 Spermine/spermidine acetyltransferase [Sedimentisphaera salicampi]OXU14585.1 Spermine/spermidine acetyltransferase [Sedimentisphaera salicampi]